MMWGVLLYQILEVSYGFRTYQAEQNGDKAIQYSDFSDDIA